MLLGAACLLALLGGARAGAWSWPDEERAASLRIDTKVRFVDDDSRSSNKMQADEIQPPVETDGFYNRPAAGAGSGRYAMQSEPQQQHLPSRARYSDGTLDSQQYCKCVSSLAHTCRSSPDLPAKACAPGKHLCCYKRPHRAPQTRLTEIFTEIEDERPMLMPSFERGSGAFNTHHDEPSHVIVGTLAQSPELHHRNNGDNRVLVGPSGPTGLTGPDQRRPGVLVGPEGLTGVIGPAHRNQRIQIGTNQHNTGILVGPEGPTGVIGPAHRDQRIHAGTNQYNRGQYNLVSPDGSTNVVGPNTNFLGPNRNNLGVLVGPDGPTGVIGPLNRNPGVLVGPNGPTGVIGPTHRNNRVYPGNGSTGFTNPGVLVGPNGPTGNIGPDGPSSWALVGPGRPADGTGPDYRNKGVHSSYQGDETAQVLVGPGGPTGIIGPGGRRGHWRTGIIGPGQLLLVGPGGPTGRLGPRGNGCPRKRKQFPKEPPRVKNSECDCSD